MLIGTLDTSAIIEAKNREMNREVFVAVLGALEAHGLVINRTQLAEVDKANKWPLSLSLHYSLQQIMMYKDVALDISLSPYSRSLVGTFPALKEWFEGFRGGAPYSYTRYVSIRRNSVERFVKGLPVNYKKWADNRDKYEARRVQIVDEYNKRQATK